MHLCKKRGARSKPVRGQNFYGRPIVGRSVTECRTLGEIFEGSMPAFGGAYLSKAHRILKMVISQGVPLVVAVAGPITIADGHRAWLIPLIERGLVAYLTTTDAVCYHDGHDSLRDYGERPIKEVALYGDDGVLRKNGVIRVTNAGFPEEVLFDQDRMLSAVLQQPEFQHQMTTTERNYRLGRYYAAQEKAAGVRPGLLSTCRKYGVPVFVGAPADGSVFLNAVKLRVLRDKSHKFGIDLCADVIESCAYHLWGLRESKPKALAVLILGGGVPKNYALQPEPTLSQIFLLPDIRGYEFDVQFVSAPVTDGSLSSCYPSEAVTWGKVRAGACQEQTVSVPVDYTMVMPFVASALLEDLPPRPQLQLYDQRETLVRTLLKEVSKQKGPLKETLNFPLALLAKAV